MTGEQIGVPSVGLMTEKFVTAAELMARVLGATDYSFVTLPHPISSASEVDLATAARIAVAESIDLLTT